MKSSALLIVFVLAAMMTLVWTDDSPCSLSKDEGLCFGSIQRYFFDQSTQNCQQFSFGGCGGNTNNFRTIDECQSACKS